MLPVGVFGLRKSYLPERLELATDGSDGPDYERDLPGNFPGLAG